MYKPIGERCLRVMTAADSEQIPSLDIIRKLPLVQMSLSAACSSERIRDSALEILRQSAIAQPKGPPEFERLLPAIITGENPNWQPWRVDFYLARLKLYFVDLSIRDPRYYVMSGTSVDSVGHFRSCGYAYLVSPRTIGLDFKIPELDWKISYEMSSSSPEGSHTARLTETYRGDTSGSFNYSVPSLQPFVPEAYYRP